MNFNPSLAVPDNCRFYRVGHFEGMSGMLDTKNTPKVEVVRRRRESVF